MSSQVSIPNPCLLAILLVCQTRSGSGPQLVYHWPPDPLSDAAAAANKVETDDEDDTSEDSEDWSSDDDYYDLANGRESQKKADDDEHKSADSGELSSAAGNRSQTILGLDEDGLVGLLSPDRSWNKRKFELSINELTFVGRPIFARQNGSWRKTKPSRPAQDRSASPTTEQTTEDEADGQSDAQNQDERQSTTETETETERVKSELTMFHLVFVMNPPPLDHTHRIKEMYDNVIKKFSRALKWVQSHHDYVWKETEALSSKRQQLATDSARSYVQSDLLETSSLAKAIRTVHGAISSSRIATVPLVPGVSISLQIPPITSTAYLPALTEPPIPPGLWLTTATEAASNSGQGDKQAASNTIQLMKSYTLLLKSPPHKIARDAQAEGGPISTHLPRFVAALRPTKSFYKLANQHQISLADVQLLARHLVYYRRAVAIPPLNQTDTYIVSPNADFRNIGDACKSYEAQFPASLPSLPKLLGFLSGIPRPYRTLIPSPDHKDIYMLMLAWLMRNGWVTQLRTFAYVRVNSDLKKQARDRERDSRSSVSQSFNSTTDGSKQNTDGSGLPQRPSFASRQSSDGRQSIRGATSLKGTSLIKSPPRASPEESRWLTHIHDSMLEGEGIFANLSEQDRDELHHYWPLLSKHFDGTTALESIPIKEGLKRKMVWSLYAKLGLNFDRGVEDECGSNKSIIVTIRHW